MFTMRFVLKFLGVIYCICGNFSFAQTVSDACAGASDYYQDRYEKHLKSQDLVCFQKSLVREMKSGGSKNCPLSSQYYQNAYERNQRSSDLVCFQHAISRELVR